MSRVNLTMDQREKFNRYFVDQEQRNIAMSIFSSINYWQDKELGFLRFSLDKLYKKYKNKFFLTLSNFKKIANKLVDLGLLKVINRGRLKFYGTNDCKSNIEIREENKKLKEENSILKEELGSIRRELEILKQRVENGSNSREDSKKKENEDKEYRAVSQETVIETAYEAMKEFGIEKGSIPFQQVIESLYQKTDKEPIHNKGLLSYIKTVIHNKVHNQAKFREELKRERKNPTYAWITKSKREEYKELENKLLGW